MKVVLHPKLQYLRVLFHPKAQHWKDVLHPKYRTQANVSAGGGLACTLLHIPVATGDEEDLSNCNCNERGNETNRKERERARERERVCVCVYFFVGKKKERICSN